MLWLFVNTELYTLAVFCVSLSPWSHNTAPPLLEVEFTNPLKPSSVTWPSVISPTLYIFNVQLLTLSCEPSLPLKLCLLPKIVKVPPCFVRISLTSTSSVAEKARLSEVSFIAATKPAVLSDVDSCASPLTISTTPLSSAFCVNVYLKPPFV